MYVKIDLLGGVDVRPALLARSVLLRGAVAIAITVNSKCLLTVNKIAILSAWHLLTVNPAAPLGASRLLDIVAVCRLGIWYSFDSVDW